MHCSEHKILGYLVASFTCLLTSCKLLHYTYARATSLCVTGRHINAGPWSQLLYRINPTTHHVYNMTVGTYIYICMHIRLYISGRIHINLFLFAFNTVQRLTSGKWVWSLNTRRTNSTSSQELVVYNLIYFEWKALCRTSVEMYS